MVANKEWPCWEITNCGSRENCLATRGDGQDKPCWQIAQGLDDYRSALNVCKDCIVYVSKHASANLSEQEVDRILQHKVECVLAAKCPNYVEEKSAAAG